ncbi:MAG TPA: hypothetical protein VNC78_02060 [Actinomycetota bacterium]|nr:hypothetical protein [Actinomycetota bacterium]
MFSPPDRHLSIQYGHATFDGCGGDHVIETDVLGQRALLYVVTGARWAELIWPVKPGRVTGRWGLTGSFSGWEIIQLAESMELARLEAADRSHSC